MKNVFVIGLIGLIGLCPQFSSGQSNSDSLKISAHDYSYEKPLDPLAPSRAAFYSAVVPGLGQLYNKKYWKVPIPYVGMGISMYFYIDNQKKYDRFRNEYKKRLDQTHDPSDPFFGRLDNDRLIRAQRLYQRNRDISALITVGIYILNIVDANIDAHLMQFNVSDKLTLNPNFHFNEIENSHQFGLSLQYKF